MRSTSNDQDLTLAGKPRKRSAQACHRCREMKIKCRLHGSGCITCLRQGLSCTFEASKTGLRARRTKSKPESPVDDADPELSEEPLAKRLRLDARNSSDRTHSSSGASSSDSSLNSHSGFTSVQLQRQQLSGSNAGSSARLPPTPPQEDSPLRSPSTHVHHTTLPTGQPRPLSPLSLGTDPFRAPSSSTTTRCAAQALRDFYSGIRRRSHAILLPSAEGEAETLAQLGGVGIWARKTRDERMLMYAMLAAGAWFAIEGEGGRSKDREALPSDREAFCLGCKRVAEQAVADTGYMFDKTVVQTQLVLKLVGLDTEGSERR